MGSLKRIAYRHYLKAVLFGAIGAASFPLVIPALGPLPVLDKLPRELGIFICIGGMFQIANSAHSWQCKFRLGLAAGLSYFSILLYWLTVAMGEYGGMPFWQVGLVYSVFVLYCSVFWGCSTLLIHGIEGTLWFRSFVFAAGWVILEWIRGAAFTGFPWGNVAYSQARVAPLLQWASLGGVYLVTFFVVLGSIAFLTYAQARHSEKALRVGGILLFFVAVLWGGGEAMLQSAEQSIESRMVGIVQANIQQEIKNKTKEFRSEIIQRYSSESNRALKAGAEILVWPEAAWPGYLNTGLEYFPIRDLGAPLLVGAPAVEFSEGRRHFNSAFWIDTEGRLAGRHDKNHLVPFGEYVPMRWLLPVDKFVPGLIDFTAGDSMRPLGSPAAGILICFDGVFPQLARRAVEEGATWIVNLTNDGWYGVSSAPYQHLDFYRFRAVENRRWVVRAANTGVSAVIDQKGRIRSRSRLNEQTRLVSMVEFSSERSPYFFGGDWWLWALCALLIGAHLNRVSLLGRIQDFAND